MDFSNFYSQNNVSFLTQKTSVFQDLYIAVRNQEERVLSDSDVALLPNLNNKEWYLRKKSAERFENYLSSKHSGLSILDIGCGNGWFSNILVNSSKNHHVVGLDVNVEELEQAARVFQSRNLQFVYGNIFELQQQFKKVFDIITLNASVQYFPDFKALLHVLENYLTRNGEIHIVDSPFYKTSELKKAQNRTVSYYEQLGFPEMASHYFHHNIADVKHFETKFLRKKDSPFLWLRYTKK